MIVRGQVYKCNICGNIVEVLTAGGGTLVCCGQPMERLKEKTQDEGKEKHVPVVENADGKMKVKIGTIPHPMEKEHFIEWIEIIADSKSYREYLKPGDRPEAEFCIRASNAIAREHCNVHGLWEVRSS